MEDEVLNPLNGPLTLQEVETAVKKLKSHKATGPDGIPAECLKNKQIIDILFKVYAYCFEHGKVPDEWLTSMINPIFKSGSVYKPLNYRGITLINIICKCYSSILNRRICLWLEENNIIKDEQNGFRQARSCLDHIYVLYTIMKNRILLNRSTFACFIDAKKAFDRVHHDSLWYKLYNIGICGKMFYAIRSLYNKDSLTSCVRINGYVTDTFQISCGVRQGDPLSPTLFSIYVNDLIDEINQAEQGVKCGGVTVSALFYADDIVVMSESPHGLQKQLDIVSKWCYKWRMELNKDKTKIIHFRPKSVTSTKYKFRCGNMELSVTTKYKYLGLFFNQHMDDSQIVEDVAKNATRALGYAISKYKNSGGLLFETFDNIYRSCVNPVMMYGAALWGGKEYSKLNTVQNRACKFFLGVVKTASNIGCHGELGWVSVHNKQKIEMVRLWCRLQSMDSSRLTYNIFRWSNSLSLRYVKNWEFKVKQLLKEAKMLDSPLMFPDINVKATMNNYKDAVIEIDKQCWSKKLWDDTGNEENGNKLRLFRCFKGDIYTETYITTAMPFHHRQKLAMLRLGCLPIQVELGRRNHIPLHLRICRQCDMNTIEDEVHLLLECPLYDDIRSGIIQHIDTTVSPKDQFCSLMSSPDIQAVLGKCIFNIMKRREIFSN